MSKAVIFYLLASDIAIPFLLIYLFGNVTSANEPLLMIYSGYLFSISIVTLNLICKQYHKYFFSNMDNKLKYLFYGWIFALSIQFIYLLFLNDINFSNLTQSLIFAWLSTPFLLLLTKFYIKKIWIGDETNRVNLLFLGNHYKLNNLEQNRLISQNYSILNFNNFHEIEFELKHTDVVIINGSDPISNDTKKIREKYTDISILDISDFLEKYLRKVYILSENSNVEPFIKPYSTYQYFIKRGIDFIVCLFFIPVMLLITPLLFIIMKVQSPGNIFFKQNRSSINGSTFDMYKYRTMNQSFDNQTSSPTNNIYSFGNFLRKYRLDEVPQLLNVLAGDMHIAGPRAEWKKYTQDYEKVIPHYNLRHTVRPGITGWAQVMFRYGFDSIDAEQKLMYDLYYIKNWSFWLELEIGVRTVIVMLQKQGI